MASTSDSSSEWKDSDFESFWQFYAAAEEWPIQTDEFLRRARDDFCPKAYEFLTSADNRTLLPQSAAETVNSLRMSVEQLTTQLSFSDDGMEDENEGGEEEEEWNDDEEGEDEPDENVDEPEEMVCEGEIMGDEADMTPEMLEFVRITRQHRQDLAEKRAREAAESSQSTKSKSPKKSWLQEATEAAADDYVMADTIGVHGARKPTTCGPTQKANEQAEQKRNRLLYGLCAMKIDQLEAQMHTRFEQMLKETNATLWPNIPLRF